MKDGLVWEFTVPKSRTCKLILVEVTGNNVFIRLQKENFIFHIRSYGLPFTKSDSNVLELLAVKEAMKMASNGKYDSPFLLPQMF